MRSRWMGVVPALVALMAIQSAHGALAQPAPVQPHTVQSGQAPLQAGAETVPRLGMVHPLPHVCVGQEPGQRDLRMLRLAYGVALEPAERVAWPWFLTADGRTIALRAGALFEAPPAGSRTAESGAGDRLRRWLETMQGRVPALSAARGALDGDRAATAAAFLGGPPVPLLSVRSGAADPWLASRMNGSALLPFEDEFGVARPCRSWPAGVVFLPGRGATDGGRVRYVLRRRTGQGLPAFTLLGYGNPGALWADFGAGRLDVALLDSGALRQEEAATAAASAGGLWGVQAGTQQVILRLNPRWAAARTAEARRALSQAINRPALAGAAERGAFRAARAFLEPVLAEGRGGEAEVLSWDSRLARKQWLASAGPEPERRLRMAVLSHPLLEAFARRLANQWQTTLGVVAVPELVDADRLLQAWNSGGYDALLDVVDLDDGSLQDLWNAALGAEERGGNEPPTPAQLAAWETRLRQDPPYLPLLTGAQFVLARGEQAAEHLRQICPGCARAAAPPRSDE